MKRLALLALLLAIMHPLPAIGAPTHHHASVDTSRAKPETLLQEFQREHPAITAAPDDTANNTASNAPGAAPSTKLQSAQEDYAIYSLKNLHDNLDWQLFTTKVIFFMVLLIVLSGIILASLQFAHDMRLSDQRFAEPKGVDLTKESISRKSNKTDDATGEPVSTLELSAKGIKISSSVIGLLILTLSVAFFFLYLKFVYPITPINS